MRDELHLMEVVDRYLDGSMTAEERTVFEQRATTHAELRLLIDDQRALREGLERTALRALVVRSAPSTGKGWIGPVMGAILIIGIASYVWISSSVEHPVEHTPVREERTIATEEETAPADGKIEDEEHTSITLPDTIRNTRTIVRADTQVMVVKVNVAADISEKRKRAIVDSVRASVPRPVPQTIHARDRQIILQNVLTPNGDGTNDRLIVPGGPYQIATMLIRDAQDREIFSTTSSAPTWHGRLSDGSRAQAGVYAIEVEAIGLDFVPYWGRETVRLVWPEGQALE